MPRYPLYRRLSVPLGGGLDERAPGGRSGRVWKISPPTTGIRSPGHPARSESLYRPTFPYRNPKKIIIFHILRNPYLWKRTQKTQLAAHRGFSQLLPTLHKITATFRGIFGIFAVFQHCYLLTVRFFAETLLGNIALAYGLAHSGTRCEFPTEAQCFMKFWVFHAHDLEPRDPQDGSTKLLRNVCNHLPVDTALHPIRREFLWTPKRLPKISRKSVFLLRPALLWGPPSLLANSIASLPPVVKQWGREADHSPQSSAEVKNVWRYTTIPPNVFMVRCFIKFRHTFIFIFAARIRGQGRSTDRKAQSPDTKTTWKLYDDAYSRGNSLKLQRNVLSPSSGFTPLSYSEHGEYMHFDTSVNF